jgi:hypothetical protein
MWVRAKRESQSELLRQLVLFGSARTCFAALLIRKRTLKIAGRESAFPWPSFDINQE